MEPRLHDPACERAICQVAFPSRHVSLASESGLHRDHLRAFAADPAELLHFIEGLPHADQSHTAAGGIEDRIRQLPTHLFGKFVAHGLLTFDAVGLLQRADVDAAVVSSAFGYFNPAVVERVWNGARRQIEPRAAGALYMECCADHGRRRLADVGGLDDFNAAASKVLAAADADSLALFAGINAEPRVTDAPGLALQLIAVLREYRGSAHLLALRCVGLNSKIAHLVKRPEMAKGFGWSEADMPEVTPEIRAALAEAEEVVVRGKTKGTVRAKTVKLERTAIVELEIEHNVFSAEEGAKIKGAMRFSEDPIARPTNLTVVK